MKKIELLELIKSFGDNDNILEALKDNEEIKGLAKSLDDISIEDFKNILASNKEIRGYYTSEKDSAISKAINKHDEKFMAEKLPALVEAEIKKRSNEGLTEDQIKLKELQDKLAKMEQEKLRSDMSNKYIKVLKEKGLNTDLIDFVLGADEEATNNNIEKMATIFNSNVETKVKEKLNNSSYVPPDTKTTGGKVTWDMVLDNPDHMGAYTKQNNN